MQLDAGRDPERFWCAAAGEAREVAPALSDPDVTCALREGSGISIWLGDQEPLVQLAKSEHGVALVQGRPDGLGDDFATALLSAHSARGSGVADLVGGQFAAIAYDAAADALLCLRDPLGAHPLFYVERARGLVVSPSPELLARSGSTGPSPDLLGLAEWVTTSTTPIERTLYEGVRRIPPGHALAAVGGRPRVYRYWQPRIAAPGERLDADEALERFDAAFERAVARCAGDRPAAVLLSGGLDSSLTAAVLAAHHKERGLAPPLAVTMKFPDPGEDEERKARGVADALGLPHLVVPLEEAAGADGIFPSGIEASRRSWYPLTNPWNASYEVAKHEAAGRGCVVGLSGECGNDVLESPWELSGDLMLRGKLVELSRFVSAQPRYYGGTSRDFLRELVWRCGVAALVRPQAHGALLRVAPDRVRRLRLARADAAIQAWALPDRSLRAQVVEHRASVEPPLSSRDLNGYARRKLLESPFNTIALEGTYLASRRSGLEDTSPFWDGALVGTVLGLPARCLQLGGHAKGLAYASLTRRIGAALTGGTRPSAADATFAAAYAAQAGAVISALGGLPRLSALGLVSERAALSALDPLRGGIDPQCWQLLATEAWLQARSF